MSGAAVKFRGKVFFAEYHVDALKACIECEEWPESWDQIEEIIDNEKEPFEFGWEYPKGKFSSMPAMDHKVRKDWYISERI
jgi:hypothetical protein